MIVSRSRMLQPQHLDLFIDNVPLTTSDAFKILAVTFQSKFTFEPHIRSVSSVIAQKLDLQRTSYKSFGDLCVSLKCFNSFILSCIVYCSPVRFSAADSHLKLFGRNLIACKFLIPDLNTGLWHHRSISSLCMLFKIYHNPTHPLYLELPSLYLPVSVIKNVVKSLSFLLVVRCSTVQYSRCFIPASTKCWNCLPQ